MLVGTYRFIIDAKNRIAIPAKFRAELEDKFIISESVDDCLTIHPMDEWNKYNEKINNLPYTDALELKRFINATASQVEPDTQGRVLLTSDLIESAGLTKNVVIIGCGEYAELWDAEVYEERFPKVTKEKKKEMFLKMQELHI